VLEVARQQAVKVGRVELSAHARRGSGNRCACRLQVRRLRLAARQLVQELSPALAANLDEEAMLAVEDLRKRKVIPGLCLGTGSHRDAEAGAARLEAVDRDEEGALAARGVVAIGEAAAHEDPILRRDRVELARAHAQKRERCLVDGLLLDVEATIPVAARLPESNARRQQVLLPGMRPHGIAEPSLVLASLEPVAARVLGVGPPDRQLGRRLELVVDDRALA
jgi:hypothetical protein